MPTPISIAIEKKGFTQEQVANELGVSRQAVQRWAAGHAPTLSNLKKLANLLDVTVAYLSGEEVITLNEDGTCSRSSVENLTDLVLIPMLDVYGSCGGGGTAQTLYDTTVQLIGVLPTYARSWPGVTSTSNLHIINIIGDSMEPTIERDGTAVIDRNQCRITGDSIYCIEAEGQIFIKRVQRQIDGSVVLMSDNPKYQPMIVSKELLDRITIIGRLVMTFRADCL